MQTMITIAVAAFAAIVAGVTGFGYGVVAMSVLPLFLGLKMLNPAITVLSAGNSLYVLALGWRHVRIRELVPLLGGTIIGVPAGIFLLAGMDEHIARRILGGILVAFILYNLSPVPRFGRRITAVWGAVAGLVAGALGGAFSMGGPPVVIYLTLRGMNKDELRSSVAIYFVMTYVYKIPLLFFGGFFTAEVGRIILAMLVPTIVGVIAGQYLSTRISNRVFQRILMVLLAGTAVSYLMGA